MMQKQTVARIAAGLALGLAAAVNPARASIPEKSHPDFALDPVNLPAKYKAMGLQFLPDGRMALAVADAIGGGEIPAASAKCALFLVSDAGTAAPKVKEIANNWKQIAGVVVAEGKLYVSDRDGFYEILDLENPTDLAGNRKLIVKWPAGAWTHGEQWHQWVFTPMYRDGYFYAPYSGSIIQGGPSTTTPTSEYSGAFLKWDLTGKLEKFAGGLRSPNGAGINPTGEMFVADNQGSWLPSSTFMHMKPGRFYGHSNTSRSNPDRKNWAEGLPYERPTAWLDNGNVRTSPSQPIHVPKGVYAGDWLLGDCFNPGLVRIALDDVQGTYNGSVFWFSKGMASSAINRMAWGPDGALYIGTILKIGNWPSGDPSPLYRLTPSAVPTAFDMRAVRSVQNGVEVSFTDAVDTVSAGAPAFQVRQWKYVRKEEYGLGKTTPEDRTVSSMSWSTDRKRVFLQVDGLLEDNVVYIKTGALKSATGNPLWNNEAWFTLNKANPMPWNRSVSVGRRASSAPPLAGLVRSRRLGDGRLAVRVESREAFTLSLRALDGSMVGRAAGHGPAEHVLSAGRAGVFLLEVRSGEETLRIPVPAGL